MAHEPTTEKVLLSEASGDHKGLRLVKAFMKVGDPVLRDAIVEFVERIAQSSSAASSG